MPATTATTTRPSLQALRDIYVHRWSTHIYGIEYQGFLSNHLLHGITALWELGAPLKQIETFAARYAVRHGLEPAAKALGSEATITTIQEAVELRGQRREFLALRTMYEAEIESKSTDSALREHLPGLVDGLAGSLLHGMIQLGYGYRLGGTVPVAEGLAYLHFSHLPYGHKGDSVGLDGQDDLPTDGQLTLTLETAWSILHELHEDKTLREELNEHTRKPIFHNIIQRGLQLPVMAFSSDPVRGNPRLFGAVTAVTDCLPLAQLNRHVALDFIIWLYDLVPGSDFVILHAATCAWSLAQVEHLLGLADRRRAWRVWFRVTLGAFIAREYIELPPAMRAVSDDMFPMSWEDIIAKTLALEGDVDEHVYKLVQVTHELATSQPDANDPSSFFRSHEERAQVMKRAATKVIADEFTI